MRLSNQSHAWVGHWELTTWCDSAEIRNRKHEASTSAGQGQRRRYWRFEREWEAALVKMGAEIR